MFLKGRLKNQATRRALPPLAAIDLRFCTLMDANPRLDVPVPDDALLRVLDERAAGRAELLLALLPVLPAERRL